MKIRFIATLLLSSALTGCAQMAVVKESAEGRSPELLIASDLVNALMQVEGYHPASTRLQMQNPKHAFGKTLSKVFQSAGYEIQRVSSPIGDRYVDYSFTNRQNAQRDAAQTYQLGVGAVKIKRDYKLVLGKVHPASDLYVAGVDSSSIQMNDHIFGVPGDVPEPAALPANQTVPVEPSIPEATEPQGASFQQVSAPLIDRANIGNSSDEPLGKSIVGKPIASNSIELLVNGESTPSAYSAGDKLVFTVKTPVDRRLSCYYHEPDAGVMRVFPNRFTRESVVNAGSLLHIPATDQWAIEATRSGSVDQVLCVSLDPKHDNRMALYESTPDLEVLPVNGFAQLVAQITQVTGIEPQTFQVSVPVN